MSRHQTHYVMLGNKYEYKNFYNRVAQKNGYNEPLTHDKLLATWVSEVEELYWDYSTCGITNYNGITIINDGMNGEYVYVGFVISKSKIYGELNDYTRIAPDVWDDIGDMIIKAIGFAEEVKILALTHYR